MSKTIIYFRNKEPIGTIDAECLWQLVGDSLQLVDDDQYIALPYEANKHLFYQVEN